MAEPAILAVSHYDGGWLGLAVLTHDGERYDLTWADSFLAAELFDLENPLPGRKDKIRTVTDVTRGNVTDAITEAVTSHDVTRVIVEIPPKKGDVLRAIFDATLEQLAVLGIEPELMPCKWRMEFGNGQGRIDGVKASVAKHLGQTALDLIKFNVCLYSAALAAYLLYGSPEVVAVTIRKPRVIELPPSAVSAIEDDPDGADGVSVAECPGGAPVAAPVASRRLPDPTGPVTAGIDPGSRFVALAIGEGDCAPLLLRHLKTYEVGETIERKTPKIIEYASGAKHVIRTRRVMTQASIDRAVAEIMAELTAHRVTRLVIEHIFDAHITGDQAAATSAIATALIQTMWVARDVACAARTAGIDVTLVRASTWRSRVAGKGSHGGDGAERIPAAVAAGFVNWVNDSIDHERDAGGVLLFGVIPEEITHAKVEHAPRKKREKTPEEKLARKERLLAERIAKRAELGCSCSGNKHSRGCHLYGLAPKTVLKYDEIEKRKAAGCQCTTVRHKNKCPLSDYTPKQRKRLATPAWAAKILLRDEMERHGSVANVTKPTAIDTVGTSEWDPT